MRELSQKPTRDSATFEYTSAVRVIGGRLSVAEMRGRDEVRTETQSVAIERPEGNIRRVVDRSDHLSILYKRTKSHESERFLKF